MGTITQKEIQTFYESLQREGKSVETMGKYRRDLSKLIEFLDGNELTQERFEQYKIWLMKEKKYKVRSANSFLSCANHFCDVMGWNFHVSSYPLKREDRDKTAKQLSAEEYEKLTKTAIGNQDTMIALILQLLSVTDLRLTELFRMTLDSLEKGSVSVVRGEEAFEVQLPLDILVDLKKYVKRKGYQNGVVFQTRRGRPVDRFYLLKKLKVLSAEAGVDQQKVSFQTLKKPLCRQYYPVEM